MMAQLYNKTTIARLDQQMIAHFVPSGYTLMTRAAQSVLDVIKNRYGKGKEILIFCGQGNNAGDGYVLARLARLEGMTVKLISLADSNCLSGDALIAYNDWVDIGDVYYYKADFSIIEQYLSEADIIVDAILGTGLNRPLNNDWNLLIDKINKHHCNKVVIAVDIPSGLDADTGKLWGSTIKADLSITFIGKKQGMYTGQARDYCGEIVFASLDVPDSLYAKHPVSAELLSWTELTKKIKPRSLVSHKGDFGKLLIIGGNVSMPGAIMLAGQAALRSGAGMVKVLCHSNNITAIQSNHAELMVHGIGEDKKNPDNYYLDSLLNWADTIAIGPGLGLDIWAETLLDLTLNYLKENPEKPLVMDADALNLLASSTISLNHANTVITPHPGEAARLLATDIQHIEENRYSSIKQLRENYPVIAILKGAGTLIADNSDISVCPYGNAGMASAGMGDCLTGILSALLAQGYSASLAAKLAVCIHAKAGDMAAEQGMHSLIASDILQYLRKLLP